jgi:hypothetical protein
MNDRTILAPAAVGRTEDPARSADEAHLGTSERQYGSISVRGWVTRKGGGGDDDDDDENDDEAPPPISAEVT